MDRNLRVLGFVAAVRTFGLTFVGPFAALYLLRSGGLGFLAIGFLVALISVPPLLWSAGAGLVADRVGRRPVILSTLAGLTATTLFIAYAVQQHSTPLFLVGIAVMGLVGTTEGPALSAYIADLSQGSERTLGFTWNRVGTNVGFALGVATGGAVVTLLGFQAAAELSTLILGSSTMLVYALLEPSPYDREHRIGGLRDGGRAVARPAAPGGIRRMLRDRLFLTTSIAFALSALVTSQWNVTYSLYAGNSLGLSYAVIGAGFATNGLLVVLGQTWTTRLALGHPHTRIAIDGTLFYVAGFLLLGVAPFLPIPVLGTFLFATAVLTIGENLLSIPTSVLPSNLAPREEIGFYNGSFSTIYGTGGLLAVVFGGVVLAQVANPLLLWIVLVAPCVPAILLLRWVGARLPARPNRA